MNISKLALIALLGSALMAFGCSDDETGTGGSGGSGGGTGGEGGTGGGTGGEGGTGGSGGVLACVPTMNTCANWRQHSHRELPRYTTVDPTSAFRSIRFINSL